MQRDFFKKTYQHFLTKTHCRGETRQGETLKEFAARGWTQIRQASAAQGKKKTKWNLKRYELLSYRIFSLAETWIVN